MLTGYAILQSYKASIIITTCQAAQRIIIMICQATQNGLRIYINPWESLIIPWVKPTVLFRLTAESSATVILRQNRSVGSIKTFSASATASSRPPNPRTHGDRSRESHKRNCLKNLDISELFHNFALEYFPPTDKTLSQ